MTRATQVSRRKDGQRFKLFVEPDRDRCHEVFTRVRGVFTNPVTVLSKRKSGAARPEVASKRARPAEVERECSTWPQRRRMAHQAHRLPSPFDHRAAVHHVAKFVQRIERQLTELQQVASAVVNTASAQAQRLEALERLLTQSDGGVAAALAARPTALAAPPAATGTVTLPRATALVPPAAAYAPAPGWFPSSSASASTGPSLSGGMGLARAAVPGPGRGVPPAGGIGAGSGSAEGAPDPVLAGADMQASYSPTLAAKNGAAEVLAGLASGQWQLPRPQHVGRLRSRDMQFNFGPPSPVTSQ